MRVLWILVGVLAFDPSLAGQSIRTGRTSSGIAYDVQGKGPAVVLITGSNLDRRMWAHEAEWLAPQYTVVRYDLRAHGQSDTATAPFDHVSDLWSVLDALAIQRATLIGLSAGATIALDAALEAPARVERLVLIGPAISGFTQQERPPFAADLIAALKARDFKQAAEVLLATTVFAVPPASQAVVRQMVTENDRLWSVPPQLMRPPARPALYRLEEIGVPTLVMIGERDVHQQVPALLLTKYIRRARMIAVAGGGHLLNLTSPVEFRVAVSNFLQQPR